MYDDDYDPDNNGTSDDFYAPAPGARLPDPDESEYMDCGCWMGARCFHRDPVQDEPNPV